MMYYLWRAGSHGNTHGGWCKLHFAIWGWMVLGRSVSFRFSGKMSSSLTKNVHITSVVHILTRKGRDSFIVKVFSLVVSSFSSSFLAS